MNGPFAEIHCAVRFVVDTVPSGDPTAGDLMASISSPNNNSNGAYVPFSRLKRVSLAAGAHSVKAQLSTPFVVSINANPCVIPAVSYLATNLYVTVR
jgi:hypothetical protein